MTSTGISTGRVGSGAMSESSKPRPTLTQVQIIQSLAEALAWFEKELSWGVAPAELSHLTGRIGEFYAAMITRGQMALETNQRGYDVVSSANERISVKTVTTSSHVSFNASTFEYVDRVIVLRVNVDDELGISVEELRVTARARHSDFEIVRYESGAVRILRGGVIQPLVVKDILRPIAADLGVSLLNPKGETKITQTLGADVIRALNLQSNHPGA
jgi:hypothetical protein